MLLRRLFFSQRPLPAFIASAQTQNASAGTTLVINKPAGTQDGMLMVAVVSSDNSPGATWTGDTGWTEVADQGNTPDLRIAWKIAASEGASYTFTCSSSSNLSGAILTYRNASFGVTGAFGTATNGGNCTAPSITTTRDNALLLAAFAVDVASVTFPTPSGMSALLSDADATKTSWAIFSQTIPTAGATGAKASDPSGTAGSVAGILFSLNPVG